MKKAPASPAILLNWSLYALFVLIMIGSVAGIYFAQTKLSEAVQATDHTKIDADIYEEDNTNARRLIQKLEENKQNIDRAAAIVADTKAYKYQDQIVNDINRYANTAGVTVLGIDFSNTAISGKAKKAPAGLKTVTATVRLQSPLPYNNYLQFLRLIEKNLTKMQVTQLDATADQINIGSINSTMLSLEVYVQ